MTAWPTMQLPHKQEAAEHKPEAAMRTNFLEGGLVQLVSVDWADVIVPVASVHDRAVLAAQDHAATVWDGVCHAHWLTPRGNLLSAATQGVLAIAPELHRPGVTELVACLQSLLSMLMSQWLVT